MRVVVVGGGGQGRQTIDVLEAAGEHTIVGVVDAALDPGTLVGAYPVLGEDALATSGVDGFVVAVGDNAARAAAATRLRGAHPDLAFVSAVHPAAVVARDAAVGDGATVMAGAVISNGCTVGEGLLMGTNSSVDHDNVLADFVSLAPGATTGGDAHVGACSAIGLGANVIHKVRVGAQTVVGAGAVVLDDLPDLVVAYGAPARVVRTRVAGEPYLSRRRR